MSICVFQTEDLGELSEVQQYLKQIKELEEVLDELLGVSMKTPPMPYKLLKLPESG